MNKGKSLNKVFITIVIIIYIITSLFVAFVFLTTSTRISEKYLNSFIQTQNELEVSSILAFMEKEIAMSRKLAEDPLIRRWMMEQDNDKLTQDVEKELNSYRDFISSGTHFIAVKSNLNYYLEDIYTPAKILKKDSTADRWFFEALEKNEDYSLNVDYQESLGEIRVWINVTVRDEDGIPLGLAGSGIYLNDFLDEIIIHKDSNLHTILLNEKGYIQGHEDKAIMEQNGMAKKEENKITIYDLLKTQTEKELVKETITQVKDSSETRILDVNYENMNCVAAMGFIPELNWYNLVLVQKNTIMSWRDFLPLILLFVLSALVIILIIIFVFTKLITNPIKKLTVAAEVVSKGDYNIRIPVEKQDEIGRLSNSFNTMTQEIKHYTENLESLVDERTKALQLANDSLTTAKKKIVDSIEYAKLLQSSILPTQVELDDTFSEHFEIYEPLDIVGGDFYFLKKTDHDIWIASIDCTGHGVPGAFMTMMANVLLKDIIDMNPSVGPAKILEMFHYKLKESLKSKSKFEHLDNGLDMGLCKIIKDKSFIQFSGAGLPLIYSDRNGIIEVRGDSLHIGYDIKKDYTFTEHELKLAGNSSCYLITDGILDLPGGKKGFGLGRLRLLSILESVKNMPLKRQREEIRKQLEDYKGEFVKKDDLLFLGFRI